MEVTILECGLKAKDPWGNIHVIEGYEAERKELGVKVFYDTSDPIYKAIAAPGTKSNAYLTRENLIRLL